MKTALLKKYRKRLISKKELFFWDWPVTPKQRAACWQNLVETIDDLIALGPRGCVEDATEVFRLCVERYNKLDTGFICTIEREELCDILYHLGGFCGMDPALDWVDEWRDW